MIIDTPDSVQHQIDHLQADGITTVIRYLTSVPGSWKLVNPAEARALAAASIRLGLVFENGGGTPQYNDINAANGLANGDFCKRYVPTLGAPYDGSVCIYFAVDNDMNANQISNLVLPYFRSVRTAMGAGYKIGVYGSGAVCEALVDAKMVDYTWLSGSLGWTNSRAYLAAKPKELVLVQQREDIMLANVSVDTNEAFGPFGDFLPFAPPTPIAAPPIVPPPVIDPPILNPPIIKPPAPATKSWWYRASVGIAVWIIKLFK